MPSQDETIPQFLAEVGISAALGSVHGVALADEKDDGVAAAMRYEPYSLEEPVPVDRLLTPLGRYFGEDPDAQEPTGRSGARIRQVLFHGRRVTVIVSVTDDARHATGFLVADFGHEDSAGTP